MRTLFSLPTLRVVRSSLTGLRIAGKGNATPRLRRRRRGYPPSVPELPDVEGFRRVVEDHAAGQRVVAVRVRDNDVLHANERSFVRTVRGATVASPSRHGKWLCVPLGSGRFPQLLVHFGMTGSFVWNADEADHRHDRIVFELENSSLRYRDMRKLTGIRLATRQSDRDSVLGDLGPDAASVSRDGLRERLTRSRRRVKPALMDQTVLAGLGNLCVDEILWRSRLAPSTATTDLTRAQWTTLHARTGSVLRTSVPAGHVPDRPSWLTGHRDGPDRRCPRCGSGLRHDAVGGRSTVWCPHCQPI